MLWLKLREGFNSRVAGRKNEKASFSVGTTLDVREMTENDPTWDPVPLDGRQLNLELCYKNGCVIFCLFL